MIGYYPVCNNIKLLGNYKPHYMDPLYTQGYKLDVIKENMESHNQSGNGIYKEFKDGMHWGQGIDFEEYDGKGMEYRYADSGTTNFVLEDNV